MFPDVFTYVIELSVIAALPDWKVTTGVPIVSLAVNVRVTTSDTFASVVVELFDSIETLLNVGTVLSTVNVAPDVGVDVTTFPAASVPVPTVTVPVPSPVGTA